MDAETQLQKAWAALDVGDLETAIDLTRTHTTSGLGLHDECLEALLVRADPYIGNCLHVHYCTLTPFRLTTTSFQAPIRG